MNASYNSNDTDGLLAFNLSYQAEEDDLLLDDQPAASIFQFVTEGVMITVIGTLGVVGNLVSLVILSRPQMRSSVNCGLQGLAVFDTIVLICAVLMLGLNTLGSRMILFQYYLYDLFPFVVPIAYPLGLIAQTGSVWTTVGVTVERYVAVCHPLRARSLCTYRRARVFNFIITVFAVCYNIPRFWEVEREEYHDSLQNFTVYRVIASSFRQNKLYYEIYYIWLYLFVMYFIPFLTLAVLNVFIWQAVQRANRDRQRLSRRQEKEISLAMMLICVVVIFFACNILGFVVNFAEYFDMYHAPIVRVSNLLVTINSSVNFIIYCIFGRKFKRMFLHIFCRYQMERSRDPDDSIQGTTLVRFRNLKSSNSSMYLGHSINGTTISSKI